jgi:homoserine O-succinyltransferase
MPVLLNRRRLRSDAFAPTPERPDRRAGAAKREATLDIGLLNNMPDAALSTTEAQFIRLLNAAAGRRPVRLHYFSLPEVSRSSEATARLQTLYCDFGRLSETRLDGLIVTGAEPRAAKLPLEPYWSALTSIIDWAEANTDSTIWSCLSAHAAVLHLDGIERRRLDEKCSGVYDCAKLLDDPLTDGLSWPLRIPHSRYHGLSESDLQAHGYRVLTQAGAAGVDIFTKSWRSLFVFFQGHPEYDAHSLQREYRRDVARFLNGESDIYPPMPANYFDAPTTAALAAFRARALADRDPRLMAEYPGLTLRPDAIAGLSGTSTAIMRNWLDYLAARK